MCVFKQQAAYERRISDWSSDVCSSDLMNAKYLMTCITGAFLLMALSGCGFVGRQLADKDNETRLLKPGAMDSPLDGYYDIYHFKFLDKYQVTHEWPVTSNCQYRKTPTLNQSDSYQGEIYAVKDIYKDAGKTWQRYNQIGRAHV